jgi:hypothetical protein
MNTQSRRKQRIEKQDVQIYIYKWSGTEMGQRRENKRHEQETRTDNTKGWFREIDREGEQDGTDMNRHRQKATRRDRRRQTWAGEAARRDKFLRQSNRQT